MNDDKPFNDYTSECFCSGNEVCRSCEGDSEEEEIDDLSGLPLSYFNGQMEAETRDPIDLED